MRTYAYDAKAPTEGAELVQRQLLLAARYRDRLVAIEVAYRDAVWAGQDKGQGQARAAAVAARKALYNDAGGLHWGTRGAVIDAMDRAFADVRDFAAGPDTRQPRNGEALVPRRCGHCKEPYAEGERVWWGKGAHRITGCAKCGSPLRFLPFDGTGSVAVQLQGDTDPLEDGGEPRKGCSARELLDVGHGQFRIEGAGRHRSAWIRVGSDGREPVWAKVPIVYHRDLPPGAVVKAARLLCYRVATHLRWSVQLMLDDVPSTLPVPARERIGIDVGWRLFADRMRVACWEDSTGRVGELSLPERLLDRWRKCEDLRSIQSKNLLAALDDLVAARRIDGERWPRWLYEATATAWQWRSRERLARLAVRLRDEPGPEAQKVHARLEAWRRQDKHLWEWEANQRENVLRARREIYRVFAARTAATYAEVRVEDLDLRDFAELPDRARGDEPDDPATAAARPRRFKACLSELMGAMRDATLRAGGAWTLVDPAHTTQACAVCGHVEDLPFDAAREVKHTCSACGVEWDQDGNAALNILRAPPERVVSTERSQDEKAKKSARSQRRAEGLAKARAARKAEKERRSREGENTEEGPRDAP